MELRLKAENFRVLNFVSLQTRRTSQGSSRGLGGITVQPAKRDPHEPPVSSTPYTYYVSKPVLLRFEAINFNKFVAASVDVRLCVVGLGDLLPVVKRGEQLRDQISSTTCSKLHYLTPKNNPK